MVALIQSTRVTTIAGLCAITCFGMAAPATAEPTDNQANNDKLVALLSGGYTSADCQASKLYPEDPFVARLACGPNSQSGGPVNAIYSLYGSVADLNKTFNVYVHLGAPVPCPGSTQPGPTAWPGGMVVCSASNQRLDEGALSLTWTRSADLLVVTAKPNGRDLASLYDWWLTAR